MAGRKEFLKKAVTCFESQTYLDRELLIVADSFSDLSEEKLTEWGYGVWCPTERANIGEKRNFGCEIAQTPYIAIWDDDDYSALSRLWQQITALEESGKAVTGYSSMKFTDGAAWWEFSCAPGFVLGTSLVFRRDWWLKHPFPEIQIGEDASFCWAAHEAGQLLALPDSNQMYATIHDGNTSKRKTDQAGFTMLSK